MTKRELRKLAEQKIKAGKSRQGAYEELKEESKNKLEEIAKIVRFIPTLENRQKFKTAQTILIGALGITILFKMLAGLPIVMEKGINWLPIIFLMPIINIALTYAVVTYKGQYYRFVGIFAILGLLRSIQDIIGTNFDPLILIDLGIAGALIGLGFYLNSKMVSEYQTFKEKYTNQQGQTRLRNRIKFVD